MSNIILTARIGPGIIPASSISAASKSPFVGISTFTIHHVSIFLKSVTRSGNKEMCWKSASARAKWSILWAILFRQSGSEQEFDKVTVWRDFQEFGRSGKFDGSVGTLVEVLFPPASQKPGPFPVENHRWVSGGRLQDSLEHADSMMLREHVGAIQESS